MKPIQIAALVIIAIAIGVLISVSADFSTYSSFADARQQPGKVMKINGELLRDKPIIYDPATDANRLTFFIKDSQGTIQQVTFKGPKPQDFERSESIVFQGYQDGDLFIATEMQLKCPSKYEDEGKLKART